MGLIENLKQYFSKKDANEEVVAPEGVCPNCWGKQEWDGEYYKFKKGQNSKPNEELYNTFIADVAKKLDKITAKNNEYICVTCHVNFKHTH